MGSVCDNESKLVLCGLTAVMFIGYTVVFKVVKGEFGCQNVAVKVKGAMDAIAHNG